MPHTLSQLLQLLTHMTVLLGFLHRHHPSQSTIPWLSKPVADLFFFLREFMILLTFLFLFEQKYLPLVITYFEQTLLWLLTCSGEICGFRVHGQNVPFEAVVLDKSTGEGVIRAKDKLDCELQKEHTFTIQAYDCGEGPDGANMKKSHKWVMSLSTRCASWGFLLHLKWQESISQHNDFTDKIYEEIHHLTDNENNHLLLP